MSKVYFSSARTLRWNYRDSVPGKLEALLGKLDLEETSFEGRLGGGQDALGFAGRVQDHSAVMLRKVVEAVQGTGAKPFVTDTVRIKGLDYLEVANQNGLNHSPAAARLCWPTASTQGQHPDQGGPAAR